MTVCDDSDVTVMKWRPAEADNSAIRIRNTFYIYGTVLDEVSSTFKDKMKTTKARPTESRVCRCIFLSSAISYVRNSKRNLHSLFAVYEIYFVLFYIAFEFNGFSYADH
jgi:hypothetical protein